MRTSSFIKRANILGISSLVLLATTSISSPTFAKDGPTLNIENFIGTIDLRTGDYDKITVTDADGAPVKKHGDRITIDGEQKIKNSNCRSSNLSIDISLGGWKYNKRKGGYKNIEEYPKLKITAPENTHLVVDEAIIFGDIGNIGSGDIQVNSCGDLRFANISGHVNLRIAGSGDVAMGNVGTGDIEIAGSGDFTAENMRSVSVNVAGSGDIQIGNITGLADIRSAGSGDNEIGDIGGDLTFMGAGSGNLDTGDIAGDADISTAGSGDTEIGRVEGSLSYASGGSGDFDADYVGGTKLKASSGGSGTIEIDGGSVTELNIKAGGSGNVRYDGKSRNAELYANGSAEITVREPSGKLTKHRSGSGHIRIR